MKKATKKELKKALRKDINKRLERKMRRKVGHKICKVGGKLALIGLIAFLATFTVYMFNLENKLIYYVVTPLLQKHYNNQSRDRRI